MGKKKQQRAQQRQAQRQQQGSAFQTLVNQGVHCLQPSNNQAEIACEKFRQAVQVAPSVWTPHRFFAFSEFLVLKRAKRSITTESDNEFVKNFISNENEPAHFRAEAAFWSTLEFMRGGNVNMSIAAEYLREGLDSITDSPKEDENRTVLSGRFINVHYMDHFGTVPHGAITLKAILAFLRAELQELVASTEGSSMVENQPAHNAEHSLLEREHKKSQVRFQTLLQEGYLFNPDVGTKVDSGKLLQAVFAAPLVWTKHRFFAFAQVLEMKEQQEASSTDLDLELGLITEQFIHNENEPAHFRAAAALWAAKTYYHKRCDPDNTHEMIGFGMDAIFQSPKQDDNRIVLHAPYINSFYMEHLDPNDLTVKSLLQHLGQQMQKLYARVAVDKIMTPREISEEHKLLQQRAHAGGKMCDCCGMTLQELNLDNFIRCERCQMVFYCSPACQKKHWKHKGHKKACREPGQIEVGDDMQLRVDDQSAYGFGLLFVKVLAPVKGGATTNLWEVKVYGSDKILSVNGDKLARLRPPIQLSDF